MGRAVSEDCQPASAALLHSVYPLPFITRSARLNPLPRAARCKSPLGCLLIAHEVWRLKPFSPGKFCELRDFAHGQNLCISYRNSPHNKLTGFLLFLTVPTISWCIIPIAIVAIIATFAAIQEGYYIGTRREII